MLWYKGWLETRPRVLFLIAFAWLLSPPGQLAFLFALVPILLAGSGIETQFPWKTKKGPVSTYFTLSLPVSRFRLFATRAGLGMLETVGIFAIAPCAKWVLFIFIGAEDYVSRSDLFALWVSLSVCASAFYFLGVLVSAFLDERVSSTISIVAAGLLFSHSSPAPVYLYRAMVSPLSAHSLPWASMGISLGVAAVLGLAAWRVVQTREY